MQRFKNSSWMKFTSWKHTSAYVRSRTQEPGNKEAVPRELFSKGLRLSMQPFAIGGMRLAYYALTDECQRHALLPSTEYGPINESDPLIIYSKLLLTALLRIPTFVAKPLLLESAHPQKKVNAFVEDLYTHREAARLAAIFSERCKSAAVDATLQFGPVYIVDMPCMDDVGCGAPTVLLLEEYLEGKFTKWNTNTGQVRGSTDDIPQASSHFTHHVTRKEPRGQPKLVVDIQGVVNPAETVYQLMDPAIHCERGSRSYGATNCGARGIRLFFESHRCNHVCRKLGLPDNKLYRPPGPPDAGASGHVAVARRQWALTLPIILGFVFLTIVVLSVLWKK
ncbi:g3360 [Coccomyxa elongata]